MPSESKCSSHYTIDIRTGEKLTCDLEDHAKDFHGDKIHASEYISIRWYWKDREADKDALLPSSKDALLPSSKDR